MRRSGAGTLFGSAEMVLPSTGTKAIAAAVERIVLRRPRESARGNRGCPGAGGAVARRGGREAVVGDDRGGTGADHGRHLTLTRPSSSKPASCSMPMVATKSPFASVVTVMVLPRLFRLPTWRARSASGAKVHCRVVRRRSRSPVAAAVRREEARVHRQRHRPVGQGVAVAVRGRRAPGCRWLYKREALLDGVARLSRAIGLRGRTDNGRPVVDDPPGRRVREVVDVLVGVESGKSPVPPVV